MIPESIKHVTSWLKPLPSPTRAKASDMQTTVLVIILIRESLCYPNPRQSYSDKWYQLA